MSEYALLSDVHGNLPALETVLADIAALNPHAARFHLGDLVGYAPWPDEVVDLINSANVAGVCGNYDSTVAASYEHCGCKYESSRQEALSLLSFEWTCEHVSQTTRQRLRALPFRLDLRPHGGHRGGPKLVLVHGAPTVNTLYWTEDRDDAFCRRMVELLGAKAGDVVAFGHTHLPWTRRIDDVTLVNTGSVGRPKDGDPRAGYVLLELGEGTPVVEFRRVEYDVERTAQTIEKSALPDELAHYLRSGGASLDVVA